MTTRNAGLRFVVFACLASGAGVAYAQGQPSLRPALTLAPPTSAASTPAANDMAMPDDLGAPLDGTVVAPGPAVPPTGRLSIDLPIAQVAANPAGRAVLERDLPGLCERPEFFMFKSMSLRRLAAASQGRLSEAKLQTVQADLSRIQPLQVANGPPAPALHNALYPLTRTAAVSIHYGGKQIGHFSRALYHRVALVIAAL